MRRTSMLALALAAALWYGHAAAETTTPIVPNDVGHWLNLEHRAGKLAPEIAGNQLVVRTILVVERSLSKIDGVLSESRKTSGCHQLILPYTRITVEQTTEIDDEGGALLSNRKVRRQEKLPVAVCSTIEQRVVFWESDGALMILGRPRNELGAFPRTLYALYQISADDRARWSERRERFATRGKVPKPPRMKTLYLPPGDDQIVRLDDPMVTAFGAEFGLPQITAGTRASEHPTAGQKPRELDRPDR